MTKFREQKQGLNRVGIPWVMFSCSRYEDRTSTVYLLGEDVSGAALECVVSYGPGSPELAVMPTATVEEALTWQAAIERGILLERDVPEGLDLTDETPLVTVNVDIFSSNLGALVQTSKAGTASVYYHEIREDSTSRIICAGDFAILEAVN